MTVSQLIAKLQTLPGDKQVVIVDRDGRAYDVADATEGFACGGVDLFHQGSPTICEHQEMLEEDVIPDYLVGVIAD